MTEPIISYDESLWFSAYGFGWGYCSFSIPIKSVCEYLGAANATTRQLMLAFELNKQRISKVLEQIEIPETSDRVSLEDFDN
ncbi:hypothetical protein [Burkholderia sp. PAMC 26561]|uniref:hypothetical protein n=1 Tax=Burkholderia sp. PAMC 26561 TaxID=1795043 RepID=UPI00076B0E70|nr:hypothetical protein [Burkholderia sp. PAMC 26561]AME26896.1 hypothetical protein AXG89_23215 [Burkholderia sp. PAMC 26561]AME27958.1 hypothetical protein AXG89_29465 [Burkholderia sp. PAMC 26561]